MDTNSGIVFVGAGKIAYSLVPVLLKNKYHISFILSRTKESAQKLALRYHISEYSDNLNFLQNFAGVVFLTVPDELLKSVGKELSSLKLNFEKLSFIHLSGALDSSVLRSLENKGASVGSMHIMQTFPLLKKVSIRNCYAAIESDNAGVKDYLHELAGILHLRSFDISKKEKVSYHIAAVYASNFINALMYAVSELFKDIKDLPDDPFEVIEPIIRSVLFNIKKSGAVNALSGPVERGDAETIKKHLQLLKKKNRQLFNSYTALSLLLLNAADEKHLALSGKGLPNKDKIKKLLKKGAQ